MKATQKLAHDIEHDLAKAWTSLQKARELINCARTIDHIQETELQLERIANRAGIDLAETIKEDGLWGA